MLISNIIYTEEGFCHLVSSFCHCMSMSELLSLFTVHGVNSEQWVYYAVTDRYLWLLLFVLQLYRASALFETIRHEAQHSTDYKLSLFDLQTSSYQALQRVLVSLGIVTRSIARIPFSPSFPLSFILSAILLLSFHVRSYLYLFVAKYLYY